jgi:hypothetical protein
MHTLELTTSQLLTLKDILDTDIEMSGMTATAFADMAAMKYYLDRAAVYHLVVEELGA